MQGGRESNMCADGIEYILFALSICCTPTLSCRGRRRRRPAKKHKVTFLLLALLSDQKRGKSQQGGLAPSSFRTTGGVHELVARAVRGKCVRQRANGVSRRFCRSSRFQLYHACEHITRDSRADSCTHCLHARYKCKAGVNLICTLTGWSVYTLVWCKLLFLQIKN